ncbi:sugar kinase [Salipiger abyssi]|uniref:sugar kinase n=1 Tax=Salipiger abyssi TaxID=1250539 RepID=UPI001A8C0EA4|nr:sugar kinase [Salipiger abyssi]MBN9887042.1 sugar kinase [Salipiger abyssi]
MPRLLSVGEALVELAPSGEPGLFRAGHAGDTLNTAWYARAMLPSDWRVAYYTGVGADEPSAGLRALLEGAGIEADRLFTHPKRTLGLYMIALKDGERSFTYWRDSSAARTLAEDPARLAAALAGCDVIHLSGITVAILPQEDRDNLHAALAALPETVTVVFDPNLRPRLWEDAETMCREVTRFAALASIALPSFDDEAAHFGDADPEATLARYGALGCAEVVVKNGEGPVHVVAHGVRFVSMPDAVTRPVDTTGAGDSFNGGYLAARLTGAEAQEAVAQAQALARKVVGWRGALMPFDRITG